MQLDKKEILANLNQDQKNAVINYYGPCFISACPGAGKTATIIARTAYMIEEGIKPDNILLFTFTKKAANEIKTRIKSKIKSKADGLTISTYHGFCSKLLRKYSEYIEGYEKNFSIYDSDEKISVIRKIVNNPDIAANVVSDYISNWKNHMVTPYEANLYAKNTIQKTISEYYSKYQSELKKQKAFDFDDLIFVTIKLLTNNHDILKEIHNKYKYIITDETQDSSERDLELIKLLTSSEENICMILDDEQSIYGFRHANVRAVLNTREHFKNLKELSLGINYRSTKKIVNASRSLIKYNTGQIKKDVVSGNKEGENIVYYECYDSIDEANKVVKIIMATLRLNKQQYKDIAILYRASYISKDVEQKLLANNIPYNVISGTPFYSAKEIKDIMSYLRFANNPYDFQAFERSINLPRRGIGDKSLEIILSYQKNNSDFSLLDACKAVTLKGKAKEGLKDFISVIDSLIDNIDNSKPLKDLIDFLVKKINYKSYLNLNLDNFEDRISNLLILSSIAEQYSSIDDFISSICLDSLVDTEDEEHPNKVSLLTMHSSKGLEFKTVIIIGLNEGMIPHSKADTSESIQEERRLFYVAMTRAKEFLFLTRPKIINIYGVMTNVKESMFIKEIDPIYIYKQ